MICNRCNHKLPTDSEFCQYCGNKIEKTVEGETNIADIAPDEAINVILKTQAKNTIAAMEANSKTQPDNESDDDFGLIPEKPIYTLALMSVDGEIEYLDRLCTANGEKIKYNRIGSMSVKGINGMIDIYETYLPSGQLYKTIYINMYGAIKSTKAPVGFILKEKQNRPIFEPKQKSTVKRKYCSRCGSEIDKETKTCTGCGKQYFRGLKFTKFSLTVIMFSIVLAVSLILNIVQLVDRSDLNETREYCMDKIDDLEEEARKNKEHLDIIDKNLLFVENDGTNRYHKLDCFKFKGKDFKVFEVGSLRLKDYVACPFCY